MLARMIIAMILIAIAFRWREVDARPQRTKPGCWYEGKRYQEAQVVNTSEPCLRCRCNEGSLRCRLRVCPRLPSPLPSGCITRTPRDNACCAQLDCGDSHGKIVTPRRDRVNETGTQVNGCLHEGVIYAPGSAMMGSRRCEYCYCISGSRRCLRPRCLLPLAGCTPLYAPYSCCPVAYNCTSAAHHPTTSASSSSSSRNGCRVDNRSYVEGEMVRDIARRGSCDNCFCAMGGVRCVPLACAPPLQGCTPNVREGHCCPSTYNCSGTIEVKAAQNYASYAFISKDYAKFRKETNFFKMDPDEEDAYGSVEDLEVEGRGHRNAERRPVSDLKNFTAESLTTTNDPKSCVGRGCRRDQVTTTTSGTMISGHETETMNNEIPTETMDYGKLSTPQEETTFGVGWTTMVPTEITASSESNTNFDDYSTVVSTLNTRESTDYTNSINSLDDVAQSSATASETSTVGPLEEETKTSRNAIEDLTTIPEVNIPEQSHHDDKAVDNHSSEDSGFHAEEAVVPLKGPVTGSPTTILMPDDILVMNVTLKSNVSVGHAQGPTISPVRSIPPDIEALLNITNRKKGEDYEYDYSQPTLPPSLPNVRIIPFVAADALVKTDEEVSPAVTSYPLGSIGVPPDQLAATVTGTLDNFYDIVTQENRFSPPIKTEGGFVPREPPYFDPTYHSTDLSLEVRTGVTVLPADMTNPHIKNTELATNCVFDDREYRHGELVPRSGHCVTCICYYGELACSDAKCPPVKIGCRRIENEKACCGEIVCVDAEESPTVVLDRADAVSASPRQPMPVVDGTPTPDPFRDVIKTEPAPDLPSLIEDMIPYFAEHRITTPSMTTKLIVTSSTPPQSNSHSPNNVPVRSSVQNIYIVDDRDPNEPSHLNETSSTTMNRTVEPEINKSWSSGGSSTEDQPQLATTERSTLPPGVEVSSTSLVTASTDDASIFSFGSVFDILFDEDSQTVLTTTDETGQFDEDTKHIPVAVETEKSSTSEASSKIPHHYEETVDKIPTTTTTSSSSANSLLKLAGCNIYGRMYRVGRIITELSSLCLECRCTEIGVQCKQLEC